MENWWLDIATAGTTGSAVPGSVAISVTQESSLLSGRDNKDCLRKVKQDCFWNLTISWNSLELIFVLSWDSPTLPYAFHLRWQCLLKARHYIWKYIACFTLQVRKVVLEGVVSSVVVRVEWIQFGSEEMDSWSHGYKLYTKWFCTSKFHI